jgi:hypothetical protein
MAPQGARRMTASAPLRMTASARSTTARGGTFTVLGVFGGIDSLGLCQEGGDFRGELPLGLANAAVAHGLVLGGIGQDLRAVQGHMAQLDEPGLLAEGEHLGEQRREGSEVLLAEGGNAVVVGVLIRRRDAVRDLLMGRPLVLAGGGLARAVGVRGDFTVRAGWYGGWPRPSPVSYAARIGLRSRAWSTTSLRNRAR